MKLNPNEPIDGLFRISKKPKGWVVEVRTAKWTLFVIKYVWKPYVKTSGMDCAWHHSSYDFALNNLLIEVKSDIKA